MSALHKKAIAILTNALATSGNTWARGTLNSTYRTSPGVWDTPCQCALGAVIRSEAELNGEEPTFSYKKVGEVRGGKHTATEEMLLALEHLHLAIGKTDWFQRHYHDADPLEVARDTHSLIYNFNDSGDLLSPKQKRDASENYVQPMPDHVRGIFEEAIRTLKGKRKPHLSTSTEPRSITSERSLRRYIAAGWRIEQRMLAPLKTGWQALNYPGNSGRRALRGEMTSKRELRAVFVEGVSKPPVM